MGLLQLYRFGPADHRLRKGYVIAGPEPARVQREIAKRLQNDGLFPTSSMERRPRALWIDTGFFTAHNAKARRTTADTLARSVAAAADEAIRHGASIQAAGLAVPKTGERWEQSLCGDIHYLECLQSETMEVLTNRLRELSPLLIAVGARGALGNSGLVRNGSERFIRSSDHIAAQWFASVSDAHVDRVLRQMRIEKGISRDDLLDVRPTSLDGRPVVEVRCIDAQIFPTTSLSHSIFLQAVSLAAQRHASRGRRVGHLPQRMVDRNRARAVASGLDASFEIESPVNKKRGVSTGKRRKGTEMPARLLLSQELQNLLPEFRSLEVEPIEYFALSAPTTRRARSAQLVRTENEMVRALLASDSDPGVRDSFQKILTSAPHLKKEALVEYNRECNLLEPLISTWGRTLDPRTTESGHKTAGSSQVDAKRGGSKPNKGERQRRGPSNAQKQLVDSLGGLPIEGRARAIREALTLFTEAGGTSLSGSFKLMSRDQAKEVRKALRPDKRHQLKADARDVSTWSSSVLKNATEIAINRGRSSVRVEAEEKRVLDSLSTRLVAAAPSDVLVFVLSRWNGSDSKMGMFELLLVKPAVVK